MTHLEKLIKAHVEAATVTTITTATEQVAEELAREILKDPAFRAQMQAMIRRHFTETIATLGTNGARPRRKR